MSLTIWKTALEPTDVQTIAVPKDAEILTAREQGRDICLWYRCDPLAELEKRKIAIVGTGHPAPSNEQAHYIGTAQLHGGALVLHIFEEKST